MKIGIIGSGNIGGALTRQFCAAGHQVSVANSRGPASLADLTRETGAHAASIDEVARGNEVVVVAVPLSKIDELPPVLLAKAPADTIVIDTSNYYPQQRDGRVEAIEAGLVESRWIEQRLGRPVVKVFNSIFAAHLQDGGKPAGQQAASRLPLQVTIRRRRLP